MIEIIPISALKDNYIWMIIHADFKQCMIIDPGEAAPVLQILKDQALKLSAILITHHHGDHTHGVSEIIANYPSPVFGFYKEPVSHLSHPLIDGDIIKLENMPFTLQAIAIPGHTLGHCAYYGAGMLFSGDTLFTGGCGRIFEGTPLQMYQSLARLNALPEATLIYCGHEYTLANLQFAKAVEPDNQDLQHRIAETYKLRQQGLPTVPATLALERKTNPFLRCHLDSVKSAAEIYCQRTLASPAEVFAVIREWKNTPSK